MWRKVPCLWVWYDPCIKVLNMSFCVTDNSEASFERIFSCNAFDLSWFFGCSVRVLAAYRRGGGWMDIWLMVVSEAEQELHVVVHWLQQSIASLSKSFPKRKGVNCSGIYFWVPLGLCYAHKEFQIAFLVHSVACKVVLHAFFNLQQFEAIPFKA